MGPIEHVPVELERGLPMVTVRVNGKGPFRFGVETGARLIGISPALVDSLGLKPAHPDSSAFVVDSIAFGGVTLAGIDAVPVRTSARGVDGLLGLPAFEAMLLTIDYPGRELVLEKGTLPVPDGKDVLAMRRVASFWGVPLTIGTWKPTAIVDTRSTGGLGFTPADTTRLRFAGPLATIGMAMGAAIAPTPVLGGRLADDVTLGRHRIEAPFVGVRALPPGFPANPILGSRVLQEFVVTIDQAHARIRFTRAGEAPIQLGEPMRRAGH